MTRRAAVRFGGAGLGQRRHAVVASQGGVSREVRRARQSEKMRLYGAIEKVVPLEDGTVRVHGIASSEAVDDQSEIVRGDAMRAALPGYMVFPAVRTMHQLDAAGTTLEAEVGDDNVTRIVAHVVDPVAVLKVKNNVFRGFSIGGRVTERDPRNSKCITGLVLSEISLVDRPANAEAVFDCWKASNMPDIQQATIAPFNAPIQIWDCGVADHKHLAKAAATRCLAERASTDVGDADNSGEPVVDDAEKAGTEVAPPTEAEIEKQASEGAATAQAIIDAALQAIESGEAALAKSEPEEKCAKCGWRTEAGGVQHHDETCPEHALNKAGDAIAKDNGDGGDMGEAAKDGDMEMADKADDGGKFADPGYQEDKKPRYKLNNEKQVRAAWSYIHMPKNAKFYSADQLSSIKSKIRAAGKKYNIDFSEKTAIAVLTKSLWDIGEVAMLIAGLRTMCERLELERAMEGDDSALPESCEAVCASACALLMAMCAEETQEVLDDTEIDEPVGPAMNEMMMSAIAQSLTKAIPDTAKVEQLMETLGKVGARHRQEIQAQLDLAAHAIDRAMDVGDLKRAEMISAGDAHKAVLDGGAVAWGPAIEGREMLTDGNPSGDPGPTEHATVDTGSNAAISVPNPTGAVPASPWPKVAKTVDPAELARRWLPRRTGASALSRWLACV